MSVKHNTFTQETPVETAMCEPRVVKTKATTAENIAGGKMYTNNSHERNSKFKAKLISNIYGQGRIQGDLPP